MYTDSHNFYIFSLIVLFNDSSSLHWFLYEQLYLKARFISFLLNLAILLMTEWDVRRLYRTQTPSWRTNELALSPEDPLLIDVENSSRVLRIKSLIVKELSAIEWLGSFIPNSIVNSLTI